MTVACFLLKGKRREGGCAPESPAVRAPVLFLSGVWSPVGGSIERSVIPIRGNEVARGLREETTRSLGRSPGEMTV